MTVDQTTTELHARGWSYGYTRAWTARGLLRIAGAHKGDQKCVAKAPTQTEALAELLNLVEDTDE